MTEVITLAMNLNAEIWDVLHDGAVIGVSGSVPGDVQLSIRINYLRSLFPDPGDRIILTLHGCTTLSYQPDGEETALTDLATIARAKPMMLWAQDRPDFFSVDCVSGTLSVAAPTFSLSLDSGRAISLDELRSVAVAYWAAFSSRSKK